MSRTGDRRLGADVDAVAPDGMDVRLLAGGERGTMAQFQLPARSIGRAARHADVEELWYVVAGAGTLWRRTGEDEREVALRVGDSVRIAPRTTFQVRAADQALEVVAVTMPPWPGDDEAEVVDVGRWDPTVPGP